MDNIKGTLTNVTKTVYKTSKGFLKSTKLTLDLSGEEAKLKNLYIDIGKKVHEIYMYGGSLGKFFDEKYEELMECERKIDILRKDLDNAKGNRTCSKCGKTVSFTSEFCPKCGTNLEARAEIQEPRMIETSYRNEIRSESPEVSYITPVAAPPAPPPIHTAVPPAAREITPGAVSRQCQICGRDNAAENKFCFSCGRIL
ncbi:MAG: zinc ribbon domain-containing protein [Defluviitaleaceae bacterium]|nr:zinc ribbon domain-containing protein [Defluviitaleaceae bacterium]MCL2835392.1 zinc ribbon domain-containing protein [Defluviitaleaceae bacterium]